MSDQSLALACRASSGQAERPRLALAPVETIAPVARRVSVAERVGSDQKPALPCRASSGQAEQPRPALAPVETVALVVRQISFSTMGNPLRALLHLPVLLLVVFGPLTNSIDIRRNSMQISEHVKP